MSGAASAVVLGLFGKLPAHGDFVRRGLPAAFCAAWDLWLQRGIAAAAAQLGEAALPGRWDGAPAWRFALPAHACGPQPAAGVLLPSTDAAGRRFPLTLACLGAIGSAPAWPAGWFALAEGLGRAACAERLDADTVLARLPRPEEAGGPALAPRGWWTADGEDAPGLVWPLPALPPPGAFALLLEPEA